MQSANVHSSCCGLVDVRNASVLYATVQLIYTKVRLRVVSWPTAGKVLAHLVCESFFALHFPSPLFGVSANKVIARAFAVYYLTGHLDELHGSFVATGIGICNCFSLFRFALIQEAALDACTPRRCFADYFLKPGVCALCEAP